MIGWIYGKIVILQPVTLLMIHVCGNRFAPSLAMHYDRSNLCNQSMFNTIYTTTVFESRF